MSVQADTTKAQSNIDKLDTQLDGLTKGQRELVLTLKAQALEGEIDSLETKLSKLDDPIAIVATTEKIDAAKQDLADLVDLASKKYDVQIDVDQKGNAKRAAEDLEGVRQKAEGFQSSLPALRGFTDEMGGMSQAAGVAGQALGDLGDFAGIMGEKFGVSEETMAGVSSVLGGIGLAVVGVGLAVQVGTSIWNSFTKQQKETAKATEGGQRPPVGAARRAQELEERH